MKTLPIEMIFPDEALSHLFSHFTHERELQRCGAVCKQWNKIVNFLNQQNIEFCKENGIFGINFWLSKGYRIGNVPRLPKNMIQSFNQLSPIFKDKSTPETTLCLLCPSKINGKPLQDMMKDIFKKFLHCRFKLRDETFLHELSYYVKPQQEGSNKAYWMRLTNEFIPTDNQNGYIALEDLIIKTQNAYQIPNAFELLLSCIAKPENYSPHNYQRQLIAFNNKGGIGVSNIAIIQAALSYRIGKKSNEEETIYVCSSSLVQDEAIKGLPNRVRVVERFFG